MDKLTERIFLTLLRRDGIPDPVQEHKFHTTRRWRFDFAWPEYKIALEVEGGVWTGGRHTRGAGFLKDMEKYNAAAATGWKILKTTPTTLTTKETIEIIKQAIGNTANDTTSFDQGHDDNRVRR